MKWLLIFLLPTVCLGQAQLWEFGVTAASRSASSSVVTYTNDFESYPNDAVLSTNAGWTTVSDRTVLIQSEGGNEEFYGGGGGIRVAAYTNLTFSANHSAEFTLSDVNTAVGADVGVVVRFQSAATPTFYRLAYSKEGNQIDVTHVDPDFTATILYSVGKTYSEGTKIRFKVTGTSTATRLAVDEDTGSGWTSVTTNIDPGSGKYLDGGWPGVCAYGNNNTLAGDNFYATDL